MKIKSFILGIVLILGSSISFAQNLVQRIPKNAQLVATFNNKAFFDFLNVDTLQTSMEKLNIFDGLFGKKDDGSSLGLRDLGFDLNSKAYLYVTGTDSIQYIGALIPLANRQQFENLLSKNRKVEMVNNLSTLYSADRTLRLSWDNNTIYILGGISEGDFFNQPLIKERYGLRSYEAIDTYWDDMATAVDTVAMIDYYDYDTIEEVVVESVEEYDEEEHENDIIDTTVVDFDMYDEYAIVDSILDQEEYADDYYTTYDTIYAYNDSIKKVLISKWLDAEFTANLTGANGQFDAKKLKPLSKNTIFDLHIGNFKQLFGSFSPNRMYLRSMGIPWYLMNESIDPELAMDNFYGISAFDNRVDVVGNKLKLLSDITLDKATALKYKEIYKKGVNPKFYNFLDKDILGFMTFNINTEAYLKELPEFVEKYYSPLVPRYKEAITLGATMFDIIVDQKAIGKVIKGDNLLVLNGVTKVPVTYKDYEYDDDYNPIEIEKSKVETVPQFLWMFSSEDTRIFDQLIKIGTKENELISHNGYYEVKNTNNRSGIIIYLQIKDGVVYVGNDVEVMKAISTNTMHRKGHPAYIALAKKNVAALLFNPKQVPSLLEELDVPVKGALQKTMDDLRMYGDITFSSAGVSGTTFKSESVIEFPNTKPNALIYLKDLVDRFSTGLMK